jgi:putative peptidoglycan lipid II flippase
VPAALGLAVLSLPVISVLFERGAFGPAEARATSAALAAYVLGLPAYVLVKVLTPGFFAREDTRTPVKIAIVCLLANVVLSLSLIWFLAHVGIALATTISAWLNAGLLGRGLWREGLLRSDQRLRRRLPGILGAGVAMAAGLLLLQPWLAPLSPTLALILLIAIGAAIFLVVAQLSGGMVLSELKAILGRGRA